MNIRRTLAIAKKEVFHIQRDPFTLGLALLLPLILVVIFGLAIELNISNIRVTVFDYDKSNASRQLIEIMGSSEFFLPYGSPSPEKVFEELDSNTAKVGLIVDHAFEKNIGNGKQARLQALLDASDSSTVNSTIGYLNIIQVLVNKKLGGYEMPAVKMKTRFLYNEELNSRWFIVPGLMVIILAILSILLTALTVAREWENGSMEQLLSTPADSIDIIIGKLAPYVVLGLAAIFFVFVVSRVFLGVPFRGNYIIFLAGCLLFLATCLALGLLISVMTRDQRMAMQVAAMVSLLPSMLLSGFIFPIESMPAFFRIVTMILPPRWFMMISRDSFLKEGGIVSLRSAFIALFIMSMLAIFVAVKKFKKDVEP